MVLLVASVLFVSAISLNENKSTKIDEITENKKLIEALPNDKLEKIHKKLWNISYNETAKVLIQLKPNSKDKIKNKIKKGKTKVSFDDELLFGEIYGDEIEELLNDSDIIKIWSDLQTQAFLDNSVYQVKADYLWNLSLNGSDVKIAILDTGIDANHEMLNGRIVEQVDFTGDNNPEDIARHGTHVTGIAAGNGGYKGIAYDALIYNGKVLDDNGYGQLSWLINGIDWAIQNNVDVISLSLGAIYDNLEEQLNSPEVLKVQEAIDSGITVVIASGNCGGGRCGGFEGVTTPGITRNAITVGAVYDDNEWAYFSSGMVINDYIKPDLVAPGVDICSSVPNGYDCMSGTSMSTPHVSGAAALLLHYDNFLTPSQIKDTFELNAIDLGETGKDIKYGSGLLNLEDILDLIVEEPEKDYNLIIPTFEVGEEDEIILEYFNKGCNTKKAKSECKPKKITVKFNLEELDDNFIEEDTKTIPSGKSKEFSLYFTPTIPGKHLLKIDIYEDDVLLETIQEAVNVISFTENNIKNVKMVIRG